MYIFRWLMSNPIMMLAAFLLCCIGIISYAISGGSSSSENAETPPVAQVEKTEAAKVDLSEAPAIEPSTLTSALVDGAEKKAEVESTESAPTETKESSEEAQVTETETETAEASSTEEAQASDEAKAETEVKTETTDVVKEADTAVTEEAAATTTEEVATTEEKPATESSESSAANYFKEHGVDPELNKPVEVTANEVKQTAVAETENKEEVSTATSATTETETTEVAANDNAAEAEKATAVTETQFSEMSADELLLMAREAYWNNGLDESAEIYQQLISTNPDVVDYKGELGNVYWRQGFPKKAAELYAEISTPMIEAGKANKVANMVGFIGLFFPEKATEIHNKLQSVK